MVKNEGGNRQSSSWKEGLMTFYEKRQEIYSKKMTYEKRPEGRGGLSMQMSMKDCLGIGNKEKRF